MHSISTEGWRHDHAFGQDERRPGERRTLIAAAITAAMMAVEITAGLLSGSMALLADGLHMASHTAALSISVAAYAFARRHARDERFSFGTGKINSLSGFASAVLLAAFAVLMASESLQRMLAPVSIDFRQAIIVALLGLVVNLACLALLGGADHADEDGHKHDHNLWSAYLHVLADAATSVLAIAALVGGQRLGAAWLDPAVGLLGAALVGRWSWELIRSSGRVLLDMQAPAEVRESIRAALESDRDCRVTDLHVWAVGPAAFAADIGIVAEAPKEPSDYRGLIRGKRLVHSTIEVHRCRERELMGAAGGI